MSITKSTHDFIKDSFRRNGIRLERSSMCELGNQHIDVPGIDRAVAKKYFESLGAIHTSIDMNGLDGALRCDLSKHITDIRPYDIVTNIGTSEHILDQHIVFENIHRLCKVRGIMIHAVPLVGNWENHGDYYYTERFFESISSLNGYKIINLQVVHGEETEGTDLVCAALEKMYDGKFIWDSRGLEYKPVRLSTRMYSMINTPYQNFVYNLKNNGWIK